MRNPFLLAILLFFAFSGVLDCQCRSRLHAGVRAEFVPMKMGFTEEPHVQLSFLLLNDSGSTMDVQANSWKIVINGAELEGSGMIFGNGPMPVGGFTSLKPGDNYELGKALPVNRYFPSPGKYTIAWKGSGFESSTITITIPTSQLSR